MDGFQDLLALRRCKQGSVFLHPRRRFQLPVSVAFDGISQRCLVRLSLSGEELPQPAFLILFFRITGILHTQYRVFLGGHGSVFPIQAEGPGHFIEVGECVIHHPDPMRVLTIGTVTVALLCGEIGWIAKNQQRQKQEVFHDSKVLKK